MAASKSKKKAASGASKGKRYSEAEKKEVLNLVTRVNADKGRGGISAASRQFGVSPLTISKWLREADDGRAPRPRGRGTSRDVLEQLMVLREEIDVIEHALRAKRAEFNKLKRRL